MVSLSEPASSSTHSLPPSPVDSISTSSESSLAGEDLARIPYLGTAARCRTAVACDKCRERKTKCSGEKPVCKRCTARGLICVYASRDVKRRPHSQAPGSTPRHVPTLREDVPCTINPFSSAAERSMPHLGHLGQYYPIPAPQLPSKGVDYPIATDMEGLRSRVRHAYPTGCPPSTGSFTGVVRDDVSSPVLSVPPSTYYAPRFTSSTGEYHFLLQSDSSDSGGSSLGSAPHTPPENSSLFPPEISDPLSYSPSCQNACYPLTYAPEPTSNYHVQYPVGQSDPVYYSIGENPSADSLSSPSPIHAHYDHIDRSTPESGSFSIQNMKYTPALCDATASSNSIVDLPGASYFWPKPSYPSTPATPNGMGFETEGSLHAGSLLLEPVNTSCSFIS